MTLFLLGRRCACVRPELGTQCFSLLRKQVWGRKAEARRANAELLEALILIPPALPAYMVLLFT